MKIVAQPDSLCKAAKHF